jgi:hypothetical protein
VNSAVLHQHATGVTTLPGHLATACASASSFGCGLFALATDPASGPTLAVLGTAGSILMPIAVALINRLTSREVAALKARNDQLAAEIERERADHRADVDGLIKTLGEALGRKDERPNGG